MANMCELSVVENTGAFSRMISFPTKEKYKGSSESCWNNLAPKRCEVCAEPWLNPSARMQSAQLCFLPVSI